MHSNYALSVLARSTLAIFLTFTAAISFADTKFCEASLVANINASIAIADYKQTNHRPFLAYSYKFGPRFGQWFADQTGLLRWLEVGGGYGLAPLEMVRANALVSATVINSQDAWPYILNLSKEEARCVRKTLTRMGRLLGARMDDVVEDSQVACYAEGWFGRLMPRLKEKYAELTRAGRFEYRVGLAEEVLKSLTHLYEVITDMFGAYFYSAARIELLDQYYEKLAPGGEGFVVFFTEDRKLMVEPPIIDKYGPRSLMENGDDSFEHTLCELYPQVFRILEVENADGITRSLHIKKVKGVSLKLRERFEIIDSWFDQQAKLPIQRQLPNIRIRQLF